ncbi:MAG: hypothetical protein V3W04_13145 [Gammaproteobacteria bacterium]
MPYFIFQVTPGPTDLIKRVEKIEYHKSFKDAKTSARAMRAELAEDSPITYKVVFAASELEAEEMMMEKREAPILREWEK